MSHSSAPACRRFEGRSVLVTGAGGLIGRATVLRFAAEGAGRIVISDISERKLLATAEAIGAVHGAACEVVPHRCSVASQEEVEGLRSAMGDEPPDVLVNVVGGLAGPALYQDLWRMDEARWDGAFRLNLKTLFHMLRCFGPAMKGRGGSVVNVTSVAFDGDPAQPDYAAAKAGVASLTRSLAADMAPAVRVNCVAPGLVIDAAADNDLGHVRRFVERSLLKRPGGAEEVAAAIAFLASEDASFVTGAILPVSGGIFPAL